MDGICALIRGGNGLSLHALPKEGHVRTWPGRGPSTRTWPGWHPDLQPPAWEINACYLKHPASGIFYSNTRWWRHYGSTWVRNDPFPQGACIWWHHGLCNYTWFTSILFSPASVWLSLELFHWLGSWTKKEMALIVRISIFPSQSQLGSFNSGSFPEDRCGAVIPAYEDSEH